MGVGTDGLAVWICIEVERIRAWEGRAKHGTTCRQKQVPCVVQSEPINLKWFYWISLHDMEFLFYAWNCILSY